MPAVLRRSETGVSDFVIRSFLRHSSSVIRHSSFVILRRCGTAPPFNEAVTLTESQSKLSCLTLDRAALEWELVSHSFLSCGLELFLMNAEFIAMLDYLERERGIKREILLEAVSNALLSASKKSVSVSRELRIDINPKTGEIRALANLIVADRVTNPQDEISETAARRIKPDAKVGDVDEVEVTPKNFGRIAAQTAKQAMMQRIRQVEKEMIYEEFKDRAGEIVSGTVRRFDRSDVVLDLGKFEAIMPQRERVVVEDYNVGDRLRAYVVAVDNGIRGPEIIVSRSHPNFVRRLFELEVSAIADGTVEIRGIAREAG